MAWSIRAKAIKTKYIRIELNRTRPLDKTRHISTKFLRTWSFVARSIRTWSIMASSMRTWSIRAKANKTVMYINTRFIRIMITTTNPCEIVG